MLCADGGFHAFAVRDLPELLGELQTEHGEYTTKRHPASLKEMNLPKSESNNKLDNCLEMSDSSLDDQVHATAGRLGRREAMAKGFRHVE